MGQICQKLAGTTELERLGHIFLDDWKEIRIHILNTELNPLKRKQILYVIEEAQERIRKALIPPPKIESPANQPL
jgi:hypothetical protein